MEIEESDIDARVNELLALISSTSKAVKEATKNAVLKDGELNLPDDIKKKHHDLAYHTAAESMTLLKNNNGILPLKRNTKVAIIGDFAKNPRYQGAGSSMVNTTALDNLLDCMEKSSVEVVGYAKGFDRLGQPDDVAVKEARELAKCAEITILCLGLDEVKESEGLDRQMMKLRQNQVSLLKALHRDGRKIVVVLSVGSSIET